MNTIRIRLVVSTLAASLAFAGCSLAPIYEKPVAPIPAKWDDKHQSSLHVESAATLHWQSFVTDDQLRKLIQLALDNNRDLRQALLNVEAARAQYRVQRADRLPGLNVQGDSTRQRLPADISNSGAAQVQESNEVGIGLTSFELDIFGRVRNLSEGALQEYLATEEAGRSVRISLIAEVIQAYLLRDSAQQRYTLAEETLRSRQASLEMIKRQQQAGTAAMLDYEEALGLTEQAKVERERADRASRQASNTLNLLIGVSNPTGLLPKSPTASPLFVQDIAPGMPSELLTNRPDIRAAEHQLRARNASIGAARAAFFPRISLTGMFGSASSDLSDLLGTGQRAWAFSPQISLPIFSGGRNIANLDLAKVRKDIAVANYEKTIQTAFYEVSDALAAIDTLRREVDAQRALVQSNQKALLLSQARYRAGVEGYLHYLTAQRNHLSNRSTLIELRTQQQIALATLFKVLGGGWRIPTQSGVSK